MPPPQLEKAMILIAVSEYPAPYPSLPGALTSAKRLAAWAKNPSPTRNYKVLEITDEHIDGKENPVTVVRLKTEITAFLAGNFIDRLVVYFAGHGIVRSAGDQFWLLSDAENEGVDVNGFLRRLRFQGIGQQNVNLTQGQLCVIADACRSTGKEAVDFAGDPILKKPYQEKPLQVDLFQSTSLTAQAFHVNATSTGDAPFCLFSAVLTEALEGTVSSVIEPAHHRYRPAIVNNRLADYLQAEIPLRAAKLNVTMEPDISTGIRMDHNYYDVLAEAVLASIEADTRGSEEGLESIHAPPPDDAFTITAEHRGTGDVERVRDAETEELGAVLRRAQDLYRIGIESGVISNSGMVVCETSRSRPIATPRQGYLKVRAVNGKFLYEPESSEKRNMPVFVRQEDAWLLVPILDFTMSIVLDSLAGDVLLKRNKNVDMDPGDWKRLLEDPESRWDTSLSSTFATMPPLKVSDTRRFADTIRVEKEWAPNNANIAGYLYDLAGDMHNIQRTAHYMANYGDLPIDLAILAAERLWWKQGADGAWSVWADLSKVPSDDTDESARTRPFYATRSFEAMREVRVQGLLPIHRQGWAMLTDNERLETPDFLQAIARKPRSRAAVVLPDDAMEVLVKNFNYEIHNL